MTHINSKKNNFYILIVVLSNLSLIIYNIFTKHLFSLSFVGLYNILLAIISFIFIRKYYRRMKTLKTFDKLAVNKPFYPIFIAYTLLISISFISIIMSFNKLYTLSNFELIILSIYTLLVILPLGFLFLDINSKYIYYDHEKIILSKLKGTLITDLKKYQSIPLKNNKTMIILIDCHQHVHHMTLSTRDVQIFEIFLQSVMPSTS